MLTIQPIETPHFYRAFANMEGEAWEAVERAYQIAQRWQSEEHTFHEIFSKEFGESLPPHNTLDVFRYGFISSMYDPEYWLPDEYNRWDNDARMGKFLWDKYEVERQRQAGLQPDEIEADERNREHKWWQYVAKRVGGYLTDETYGDIVTSMDPYLHYNVHDRWHTLAAEEWSRLSGPAPDDSLIRVMM